MSIKIMSNMRSLFLKNQSKTNIKFFFFFSIFFTCFSVFSQKNNLNHDERIIEKFPKKITSKHDITNSEMIAEVEEKTLMFIKLNFDKFNSFENERLEIIENYKSNLTKEIDLNKRIDSYAKNNGYLLESITITDSYKNFSNSLIKSLKYLRENEKILIENKEKSLRNK